MIVLLIALLVVAVVVTATVAALVVRRQLTVSAEVQLSELRSAIADLRVAAAKASASADRIEKATKEKNR